MQTFKDYYTKDKIHEFKNIISKECSDILKLYINTLSVFYRGYNKNISTYEYIIPRKDRRPLDTDPILHEYINKVFIKVFKWPVRNGIFATASRYMASSYGNIYIIFPVNGFKFVYGTKNIDLSAEIDDLYDKDIDDIKPYLEKRIKENYTDKNLKYLLDNHMSNEVSFNCKGYYLLNPTYFKHYKISELEILQFLDGKLDI